jgi:hypothetical protein
MHDRRQPDGLPGEVIDAGSRRPSAGAYLANLMNPDGKRTARLSFV